MWRSPRAGGTRRSAASLRRWLGALLLALLPATAPAQPRTPEEQDRAAIAELVLANHILSDQGVVDGFGHVSVRSARDPGRYFIARSMAPALVTEADILEYTLDDQAVAAGGRASYLERHIHAEVYRARPDVMAVVHSHSPAVIPFGASDVPLRPITHMAAFLIGPVPVFEIRDAAGPESDLLVRTPALGAALARSLGGGQAVLMRGHGDTVVGASLRLAVAHAIYTEFNARVQADAIRLGGRVTYLNEAEARAMGAQNDALVDRPWSLWVRQAERRR